MITSTYIVIIRLTWDQVLICKYCYYFDTYKIAIATIFFVEPRGM